MRFRNLTIALVLAVLATVGLLAGVKYHQISGAAGGWGEAPQAVTIAEASSMLWQPMISTTGTVVAKQSVDLKNEVLGKVAKVNFTPGEIVEAGTLLLELDTSVEQAELRAAQSRLKLAQLAEDRVKKSAELNAVTPMELDVVRATTEAAAAEVQRLEAMIERKRIKAPFKGTVGMTDIHLGQFLSEGTMITSLQGVDEEVYVDFAMPQEMAQRMPMGAPVKIVSGESEIDAAIQSGDALISQMTRSRRTRVAIKHAPQALEPGMSVSVMLHAAFPRNVVTVPAVSIRRSAWGDSVFVVVKDDKGAPRAKRVSVDVGASLGERVVINSGIVAGQQVVADGSFKLQEGNLLNPTPATRPASTQPAAK